MDEWPELSASLMRRMVSESVAQETKLVSPGSYEKDREAIAGVLERLDGECKRLERSLKHLRVSFFAFGVVLFVLCVAFCAYVEGLI